MNLIAKSHRIIKKAKIPRYETNEAYAISREDFYQKVCELKKKNKKITLRLLMQHTGLSKGQCCRKMKQCGLKEIVNIVDTLIKSNFHFLENNFKLLKQKRLVSSNFSYKVCQ